MIINNISSYILVFLLVIVIRIKRKLNVKCHQRAKREKIFWLTFVRFLIAHLYASFLLIQLVFFNDSSCLTYIHSSIKISAEGLDPSTSRLWDLRSNQLSYADNYLLIFCNPFIPQPWSSLINLSNGTRTRYDDHPISPTQRKVNP